MNMSFMAALSPQPLPNDHPKTLDSGLRRNGDGVRNDEQFEESLSVVVIIWPIQ